MTERLTINHAADERLPVTAARFHCREMIYNVALYIHIGILRSGKETQDIELVCAVQGCDLASEKTKTECAQQSLKEPLSLPKITCTRLVMTR